MRKFLFYSLTLVFYITLSAANCSGIIKQGGVAAKKVAQEAAEQAAARQAAARQAAAQAERLQTPKFTTTPSGLSSSGFSTNSLSSSSEGNLRLNTSFSDEIVNEYTKASAFKKNIFTNKYEFEDVYIDNILSSWEILLLNRKLNDLKRRLILNSISQSLSDNEVIANELSTMDFVKYFSYSGGTLYLTVSDDEGNTGTLTVDIT